MATPNDSGQPKKPQPPLGKPAQLPPGAKPGAAVGKPASGPVKPQPPAPPGTKPAMGKPVAAGGAVKPTPPAKPGAAPPPPGKAAAPGAKPAAAPAKPGSTAKSGDQPAVSASKVKPAPVRAGITQRSGGRRLGQVLVDLGYIDESQLWELLDEAKNAAIHVGQAALSRGLITENQLMQALADQFGMKLLTAEELKPQPEALTLVPEPMATVYKVLPLTYKDNVLTVAMGDPNNMASLDDLRNFLNVPEVVGCLAPQNAINDVLSRCYQGKEESIMDIISALQSDEDLAPRKSETSIDLESLMEMQEAAPVRKLLNMVMLLAIKDRASDIHFEPFEEEYKLRYRCDGVMYEMVPPPRHLAMAISTRIKVMANLDIAERRLPQDGRIELNVGGNQVDMRVSILPTMFGESCVIRVLDRGNVGLDLNRIGIGATKRNARPFKAHLDRSPKRRSVPDLNCVPRNQAEGNKAQPFVAFNVQTDNARTRMRRKVGQPHAVASFGGGRTA
ncbi:MAG: ATPase, T2SS/T4P/T4SS family [Gemmataceae bacterium]|nr:ATPase, T2SS/T4P/T4SS family [Gemmataceae bacterium]